MYQTLSKPFMLCFGIGMLAIYILGMFIPPMEVDAAQYAYMSMEMLQRGSFLTITDRFEDYLDKPPLLFWLSTASYYLFGVSAFAYKLPTLLITLISYGATYKIGKLLYNRSVGFLSVVIQSSLLAYVTFLSDVRTDALLSGFCMISLYGILYYLEHKRMKYFFIGFIGIAGAMLSKGPIGCMLPVVALSCHWIYSGHWKYFLRWEWIVGLLFVLLLLSPMLLGLYRQFGTEGIVFFFWTQSFGRITGQNTWKDETTFFFFMHTFLWAFLPWSFHFLHGLFVRLKGHILRKSPLPEILTLGGGLITFFALSLSQYKLPHYIYVTFPLLSIFTSYTILRHAKQHRILLRNTGIITSVLAAGFLALIVSYVFPSSFYTVLYTVLLAGLVGFCCYFRKKWGALQQALYPISGMFLIFYFMLNLHFYPRLLYQYHLSTIMAREVQKQHISKESIFFLGLKLRSFDFHTGGMTQILEPEEVKQRQRKGETFWLFTTEDREEYRELLQADVPMSIEAEHRFFKVTMLTLPFLNPKTRQGVLRKGMLLRIN